MTVSTDHNTLTFAFPEVDPAAVLHITFHRTLRVPDDDTTYGLPPSLGSFALRETTNGAADVLMPMWQSEAAWIDFTAPKGYSFLVKVGVGGINAITGDAFTAEPDFDAGDYLETDEQPWLDGYRVDATTVRQFVARRLGTGYTVAEQLTGAHSGALEFSVVPLRRDKWQHIAPIVADGLCFAAPPDDPAMGLGAGGSIAQSIATPIQPHENWCQDVSERASVRIMDSASWQQLTDEPPHHRPLTIEEYAQYGFPWFAWYDDTLARQGASPFETVKTVRQVGTDLGESPLPDNTGFTPPTPHIVGGA
ncbi:hypothetical protein ACWDPV_22810 [Gordonia sp. NPDC003504]